MSDTSGISPAQRRLMGVIVGGLMTVNTSLAGLAASNSVSINPILYVVLGIASILAWQVKVQYEINADVVAANSGPKTQ